MWGEGNSRSLGIGERVRSTGNRRCAELLATLIARAVSNLSAEMMIILLLFLQKQNLAFAVYLFGSVLSSKRLFRGPSTNDMKK